MISLVVFLVLAVSLGKGDMIVDESDQCIWQVFDCYKDLTPIYHAMQSFNLEPLSKGKTLNNVCRKLPLAIQCENAYHCEASESARKYLDSSTKIYEFVCKERDILKMERQCWKNPGYKRSLQECTSEFKAKSQNEVCADTSLLKSCLTKRLDAIDDCSILADIFLEVLIDNISSHFLGNVC